MVAGLVAKGVIEALELIQIAEQQRDLLSGIAAPQQQPLAMFDEGPPVADTGQRVAERRLAVLQFGPFAHHRQGHEGDADRVEHGLEDHQGEEVEFPGHLEGLALVEWNAQGWPWSSGMRRV